MERKKRTNEDILMYKMCESCKFDYGEFGSRDNFGKTRGIPYRGCRRYLDTKQHLKPAPWVDKSGAHCVFWEQKTGEKHKDARFSLKPMTFGKGVKNG